MTTAERASPLPQAASQSVRGGMSLGEAIRVALQGLAANKLRSFLTMLGVIIGVGSFIATVALGQGGAAAAREMIQRLGTNVLSVFPSSQRRGGVSYGLGSAVNFTLEDAQAIAALPSVRQIAPEYRGRARLKYRGNNTMTSVIGTTPEHFEIRNISLQEGQIFTADDVRGRRKVVVLGHKVYEDLFGDQPCLNRALKLNNQNFRVIGLAAPKGAMGFQNMDDQVYIPLDTAMRRVFGADYLSGLSVQAADERIMTPLQSQIEDLMALRKRTPAAEEPPVRVFSQGDIIQTSQQQTSLLTMLLAGVALVSLLVGGIGIMNIMLVSVTERTREIGIRKAIGAKNRDVLNQFLIESMTLSLVGGLIGTLVGVGFGISLKAMVGWSTVVSWQPILLANLFAAGIGVLFGIYPAMKAARLNPIDALRYE